MKRDMELIRFLLITHESDEKPPELERYSNEDVLYNLQLMHDAGLVEAHFIENGSGEVIGAKVFRLTWMGHDFLDASRDNTIWHMAKEKFLKPGVSWTVSVVLEWMKMEVKRRVLGVPPSS